MTPAPLPVWASPSTDGVRLFWWVRVRIWRSGLSALAQAPVKLGVILVTWTVLLVGILLLSYEGIKFVHQTAGLGPFLLSRLWFLFLFVILMMLAVSQVASAYSTMIRAPETRLWMTLPVSARTIGRAKWIESSFYSAWAVVLLVLPMCLAYLVVLQQPVWLVLWIAAGLLVPLIAISTAVATIVLLVWLRWVSRALVRRELIPFGLVLAGGFFFWLLGERQPETPSDVWFLALQELLPRMQIAMSAWLPSSWAATGIDAAVNARWVECLLYSGLLWTTALVCWRLFDHAAAALLLSVLRRHAHPQQGAGRSAGEAAAFRLAWWMRRPFSASLMKDALLVLRDPMQWSQTVMFFGLLGVYFANIHRLAQFSVEPTWRIGVASLNLACTLLVFGSLAVRFVFPQMSLEGRNLWLLRTTPNGMRRLLFSKLCLYGAFAVVLVEGLLALSMSRLAVPEEIRWWLSVIGAVASLTLVGLTVGLGARWIDMTAQDSARVVSSSNGALVLVFMLCYVACVVVTLVAVWGSWVGAPTGKLFLVTAGLLTVSFLTGFVPVRAGLRNLERLDYA
jgi:ABC-2 type transport system permease protein